MKKHRKPDADSNEADIQALLDSIEDLASRMGHSSHTMEIIGIAAPQDADALTKKTAEISTVAHIGNPQQRPLKSD